MAEKKGQADMSSGQIGELHFLDPLGFVLEGKELLFFCQRCVQVPLRYSPAHSTADQNLSALGGF